MHDLFALVLSMQGKALLLVAVLYLTLALHRSASARQRYWSCKAVFAALLLIPALSFLPSPKLPTPTMNFSLEAERAALPSPAPARSVSSASPSSQQPHKAASGEASASVIDWPRYAALVYFAVAGALLLLCLAQCLQLQLRIRRLPRAEDAALQNQLATLSQQVNLKRMPQLRVGEPGYSPHVWGCRRPSIVVPRDFLHWPGERQQHVLLHELVHIRQRDWLSVLLSRVCCCLYWPNPLVWQAARRLAREGEKACDDQIVAALPCAEDYAHSLLQVARGITAPSPALPAVVGASALGERIALILAANPRRNTMNKPIALAVIVVATAVSSFGFARSGEEPNSAGKPLRLEYSFPDYPAAAKADKLEGYVELEFDINAEGRVENISVVQAEPEGVFDEAASSALQQWIYLPAYEGDRARAVRDVKTRMTFVLGDTAQVVLSDDHLRSLQQSGPANAEQARQVVLHYRTAGQHLQSATSALQFLQEQQASEQAQVQQLLKTVKWREVDSEALAPALRQLQDSARAASNGNLYVALAAVHEQREQWGAAQVALAKAFEKGALQDVDEARFLLARVLFHAGHHAEAKTLLDSLAAAGYQTEQSQQWSKLVSAEIETRNQVAQHLLDSALR